MEHERWVLRQLRVLMACDYEDTKEHWQCPALPMVENPVKRKEPFQPTPWVKTMRKAIAEGL